MPLNNSPLLHRILQPNNRSVGEYGGDKSQIHGSQSIVMTWKWNSMLPTKGQPAAAAFLMMFFVGVFATATTPVPANGPDFVEPLTSPIAVYTRVKSPGPQMHFTAGLPFRFLADAYDPNEFTCPPGHPP